MINFSNTPPSDPRGESLTLHRTPTLKPLDAIVTCSDLIGCRTHYYHGRTLPCSGDDCAACQDGMAWRWHAWLSAYTAKTHIHIIFECTAQSAATFVSYRNDHATLRGCLFRAERPSHKPNGRVRITTKKFDLETISLPLPPDLPKCLAMIWNIPTVDLSTPDRSRSMPHLRVNLNPDNLPDSSEGNGHFKPRKPTT